MPALIEKLSKAKPEPLIRAWAFLVTVSPTPFAHPRGKELSSLTVNVVLHYLTRSSATSCFGSESVGVETTQHSLLSSHASSQ
jgi:hypothetical protein